MLWWRLPSPWAHDTANGTTDRTSRAADAAVDLGSAPVPDYEKTQTWGRFFHASPGVQGIRYRACRAVDRIGVATVLLRKTPLRAVTHQHLLTDDLLWPLLMAALDSVDVAAVKIDQPTCGRCQR